MDLSRENFRVIIYYNFRRGLTQHQCIVELNSTFGDDSPSKTTIYRWYSEFIFERASLKDESRGGRPKSAVCVRNIDAVREMVKVDRHVTYREIQTSLGIGMTAISEILHENLGAKKICSRWIPHNLTSDQKEARVNWCKEMMAKFNHGSSKQVFDIVTGDESWIYSYEPETKQQSTVWVFQDEANPTKVVRARSTSKQMVACFFKITGHVATIPLQERRTVNSEWYTTVCLPEVLSEIRKNNCRKRVFLHHDNASSHTSAQTKDYLLAQNVKLTGHPPYSPDLAPNDYFLFPTIKKKLRGQRFPTPEEAVNAFKNLVLEVPSSEWQNCFQNWFRRMEKCVNLSGEYFEKQ